MQTKKTVYWWAAIAAIIAVPIAVAGLFVQLGVGRGERQADIPIASSSTPNETGRAGASPAPVATLTPTAEPWLLTEVSVPGNDQNGVRVELPGSGNCTFTYVSGAYSPYPSDTYPGVDPHGAWIAVIRIYINRLIDWKPQEPGNWIEPMYPDAEVGAYGFSESVAAAQSINTGAGQAVPVSSPGYAILVAIDQKGAYQDNRGAVDLNIQCS